MNMIVRLKYELAYYDSAVDRFNHYTTRTPPILGQVIPKTQKMVLDADLLNTQHYKVRIKGKVEQSKEK